MAASPGTPGTTAALPDEGLVRAIGLGSAVLFVLGSVIGSGIFLTTGVMASVLPSPTLILLAWAAGGYFPGLWTSPVLGALGVLLWHRLWRGTVSVAG